MGPLSPRVSALLGTLVEERVGIHYRESDADLFASKLAGRMAEAGFESALDYYYFLRYDPAAPAEFDALVDVLVVGETYFFREVDALRAAIEHVVRPAVRREGHARIWSAACASGEEPISLAMLLDEASLLSSCTIVATDVSARAIARARDGVYRRSSLRGLERPEASPELLALFGRSTKTDADGLVRVRPDLVRAVDYRRLNLLDTAGIAKLGRFDLVLCRNVLIYFTDATVRRVVEALALALAPQGRLLVGTAESLLRFGTVLRCEERGGAFLYGRAS